QRWNRLRCPWQCCSYVFVLRSKFPVFCTLPTIPDLHRPRFCLGLIFWEPNSRKLPENRVFRRLRLPILVLPFLSRCGKLPNAIRSSIRVLLSFWKLRERCLHSTQWERFRNLNWYKIRIRILYFLIRLLSRLRYISSLFVS